jgi:putative type II/III system pilus formation protein
MRQLLLAILAALAPAAALAADLELPLDQSALITLRAPAHDVIIGNPAIADVLVSDRRHLIVTAKGRGVTNLVVTDAKGNAILREEVVVGASGANRVSLISGAGVESYACAPRCELVGATVDVGHEGASAATTQITAPAPAANARDAMSPRPFAP